ncbi:hypothetical protein AAFO92_00035 [Roseovarius sp. CAU 1744]|uniref:hypothetical protein n=1 Tax=Roseovarius sp. CAU 1744 TaxID=3140368 RepID=UPI00325B3255
MRWLCTLLIAASPALADVKSNGKTIDCYCTDRQGERVELGEMTCLQVDGRMFMAQCQMSLNVPMWREVSEGCLSSSLRQSIQPAVDTGGVDS